MSFLAVSRALDKGVEMPVNKGFRIRLMGYIPIDFKVIGIDFSFSWENPKPDSRAVILDEVLTAWPLVAGRPPRVGEYRTEPTA